MKGYMYTLEVFIAVSIIFLTIVFAFRNPPSSPELELSLMKKQGFEALQYLYDAGELEALADSGSEATIESRLSALLPANTLFEAEICGTACSRGNVPENQTVIAV